MANKTIEKDEIAKNKIKAKSKAATKKETTKKTTSKVTAKKETAKKASSKVTEKKETAKKATSKVTAKKETAKKATSKVTAKKETAKKTITKTSVKKENSEKDPLKEKVNEKIIDNAKAKSVNPSQNQESSFLDSFNWHNYEEGIDVIDEKQLAEFEKLVKENFVDTSDEDIIQGTVVYITDRAIIDINAKSKVLSH